jgi:hypothetical protein
MQTPPTTPLQSVGNFPGQTQSRKSAHGDVLQPASTINVTAAANWINKKRHRFVAAGRAVRLGLQPIALLR